MQSRFQTAFFSFLWSCNIVLTGVLGCVQIPVFLPRSCLSLSFVDGNLTMFAGIVFAVHPQHSEKGASLHSLLAMSLIFGGLLLLLSKISALRLTQLASRASKIWADHRRRTSRSPNPPAGFHLLQSVIKAEAEADDD